MIFTEIKRANQIEDKVKGRPSAHRKIHFEVDGVVGKNCSVPECGWKPLTEFNFSSQKWDRLRTTCKSCLSKKRKQYSLSKKDSFVSQGNIYSRLNNNIRGRLLICIHDRNLLKSKQIIDYLGCTIDEFKKHIETTFTDGMSWDKYGHYIDHKGVNRTDSILIISFRVPPLI